MSRTDLLYLFIYFQFKFISFNWRLITLQYCIRFAIHQHVSATGIRVFPMLNAPLSSLPVPYLSAPAPGIQYHALNLDWRFVSYMILCMFQCHSPKSSHPLPLPQSPKDCSIHLGLFCCLTYREFVLKVDFFVIQESGDFLYGENESIPLEILLVSSMYPQFEIFRFLLN